MKPKKLLFCENQIPRKFYVVNFPPASLIPTNQSLSNTFIW
jgi:hypothetical protein